MYLQSNPKISKRKNKFFLENYKKAKHWISRNTCYESDEEELGSRGKKQMKL